MMKKIIFLGTLVVSSLLFSQVKKKSNTIKKSKTKICMPPPPIGNSDIQVIETAIDSDPMAYLAPEVKAVPKEGLEGLQKWIQKNSVYPISSDDKKYRDEVLAVFDIEKDGSVSNIRLYLAENKSSYATINNILLNMEKWIAAKDKNNEVKTEVRLSFTFDYPKPIQVERLH